MKNAKFKFAWVTRTDVNEWAKKHLLNKFGHPAAEERYEQLRLITTLKGCSQENRDLLGTMKTAWRKQKSRKKPKDTKPYNFELSKKFERQLKKLAVILGETQAHTLELIVDDRIHLENQYKSKKKDEGAYKKQSESFERELNKALNELFEYKLRLTEAGIDTNTPLNNKQKDEIARNFRARKVEVIKALPPLSENKPKRAQKSAPTLKMAGTQQSKTQTSPVPVSTISALQQPEDPGHIAYSQAEPPQNMPSETDGELSRTDANGLTKSREDGPSTQQDSVVLTNEPTRRSTPDESFDLLASARKSDAAADLRAAPGTMLHLDDQAEAQLDIEPSKEGTTQHPAPKQATLRVPASPNQPPPVTSYERHLGQEANTSFTQPRENEGPVDTRATWQINRALASTGNIPPHRKR